VGPALGEHAVTVRPEIAEMRRLFFPFDRASAGHSEVDRTTGLKRLSAAIASPSIPSPCLTPTACQEAWASPGPAPDLRQLVQETASGLQSCR
jgi:hypothetical protein